MTATVGVASSEEEEEGKPKKLFCDVALAAVIS